MKEDLGFSKEGFESLGSHPEQNEETENRNEKPAWYETESFYKPRPAKESEGIGNPLPDTMREEKTFDFKPAAFKDPDAPEAKASAAEASAAAPVPAFGPAGRYGETAEGKIYLPDPPPKVFLSDKIADPRGYVAKKLAEEAARRKARAKREKLERNEKLYGAANTRKMQVGLAIDGLFLILSVFILLIKDDFIVIGLILSAVCIFFQIFILWKRRREQSVTPVSLVKPYAVEKKFGGIYKLTEEKNRRHVRNCALRIYFLEEGKEGQALTESVFTEEELDSVIAAFLHGDLIAGATPGGSGEERTAFIFSPEFNKIQAEG